MSFGFLQQLECTPLSVFLFPILCVCALFILTFFCVFHLYMPVCLVCIQMVCESKRLLIVHRKMKQASSLVTAVTQSHIKAPVVQPIDD